MIHPAKPLPLLLSLLVTTCVWAGQAHADSVLASLRKGHPRLILTEPRLAELKRLAETDKTLSACVGRVLARADGYRKRPALTYKKIGPRLLGVSRECLARVYTLGLAWRWTGKEVYATAARRDLLAVCAFRDWNPSHFLDTAEMSHAVAIGYDWLYSWLDDATREQIRDGLIRLGLTLGAKAYSGKARYGWWRQSTHNWNQVCNGGLAIGALAVADTDAKLAETVLNAALVSLPRALATYAPDGAWPEGPGYWYYATRYTTYALAAMQSALGKDFGLSDTKGLATAAMFPVHLAGPIDRYLAFADSGSRRGPMACQFWLAKRYDLPVVAAIEHELISRYGNDALHVVWYVRRPRAPTSLPLQKAFAGPVEVAVFRSAWDDPNALFVGVKAGTNRANHAHLDLGNFELDALGVRWAEDLGADDYNLPGYWSTGRGGRRWKYYRLGSLSHNVPLIDDQDQDAYAKSKMVKFHGDARGGFAVVDLTAAYKPAAKKLLRGVKMLPGRRAVLVQDELDLARPCRLAWGMTTRASVLADGGRAVLKQGSRRLIAVILSPAGAKFTVESAEQKPPQRTNKGYSRLMMRLPKRNGSVRVAVLLAPVWSGDGEVKTAKVVPLREW